jgi:predicted histidine transporter YuiF (NhaC family)
MRVAELLYVLAIESDFKKVQVGLDSKRNLALSYALLERYMYSSNDTFIADIST